MVLKAGSISDFTDSMAKAMEDAFLKAWPEAMNGQKAPDPNNQMRLMFVAIAQGIVSHLKDNPEAFKVMVTNAEAVNLTGTVTSIEATTNY